MKKVYVLILMVFITVTSILPQSLEDVISTIPNPQLKHSWIYDGPGLLDKRYQEMNSLLDKLEKETSSEVALVIVKSIGENVPKEFATELFNTWKIGKKGKDNGMLIVHVMDQRRIEIETGYGMEAVMPDVKCKWIIDEIMIPFFREGSFSDGHLEGLKAVIRGIRNPEIKREDLIAGLATKPGQNVDKVIEIETREPVTKESLEEKEQILETGLILFIAGVTFWIGILVIYGIMLLIRKESYAKYKYVNKSGFLQYIGSIMFGMEPILEEYAYNDSVWTLVPVLGLVGWLTNYIRKKWLKNLRDEPRVCFSCGKKMARLGEAADDAWLEKGQVTEENIDSLNYDVWQCVCGEIKKEVYSGSNKAEQCDKCNYKTLQLKRSKTIRKATTSSSGLVEDHYKCANCGHQELRQRTIPRKSSSSSGSGGSSSGSFGGGSSGGGGAGGSY